MLAEFFKAALEALLGFVFDLKSKTDSDAAHEAKGSAAAVSDANAEAVRKTDEIAQVAASAPDRERTRRRLRDGSF